MVMSILVAIFAAILCVVMDVLFVPVIKDVVGKSEKKIATLTVVVFNAIIVGLLVAIFVIAG